MKQKLPHQVQHVHLESNPLFPDLNTENQGIYLVFWWREIPLGHGYLVANIKVSEMDYYKKLIHFIGPTLEYYDRIQGLGNDNNWEQLLLQKKFKEWELWMQNIFSPFTSRIIQKVVPISVVICTRNRAHDLHLCLNSLMNMNSQPEEIIIIDNAPNDESTKALVGGFEKVKYFKEPRAGLSFARNLGIKKCSNGIIAFTDDDVEVHKDWAFRIWETFHFNQNLFGITGLVLPKELDTPAQLIFEKSRTFNRGYMDLEFGAVFWNKTLSEGPPVWKIGAGANMAFKKEIFESVGDFDIKLGAGASGCSEDSEMWFRILNKGYEMAYCPRAIVFHKHRKTMEELKSQAFQYMKGHIVAALVQQQQNPKAGYKKYIYNTLPRYYLSKVFRKWKNINQILPDIWNEVSGIKAGLVFYYKNKSA
jgi:glycosyltransferase involved in cell wall biosynthesis